MASEKLKILVVDDESRMRKLVRAALETILTPFTRFDFLHMILMLMITPFRFQGYS